MTMCIRARVRAVTALAQDVRGFELVAEDPQRALPAYEPGAHIDVHLPSGNVRQYSLVGAARDVYEIAIQLAIYSRADYIYNPHDKTFEDFPKVDQDIAVVAHVPSVGAPVEVHEIDIARGWEWAEHAIRIMEIRSAAKSKRNPAGRLRVPPQ